MSLPLLQTKLYVPSPRMQPVQRTHLLARLHDQRDRPLTLVAAPPGFGKTTLVSTWLAQANQPVAWLSLDEEDNDPIRFFHYLIAALQTRHPSLGEAAVALLSAPQPPLLRTILTLLLNDLGTLSAPLTLVLDDYHWINAQPIHDALTFFIEHLPPQCQLIMISRVEPPLPLARWRVRQQLIEIRTADLRFTLSEATLFLNQVMGLALTESQIAMLETRTEGWIAGLQLAALSLYNTHDRAGLLATFTGTNRLILDYLVEEVLTQQPEAVRRFLHGTVVLDRLCAPLCDAVLGRQDSQLLLEQLERANLFLVALDPERRWYRYHPLFADAVRHTMLQNQTAYIFEQRRRASAWHRQAGLITEAVRYALQAEDWSNAAQIIEQQVMEMLGRGEGAMLRSWLRALPEAIVHERPYLSLAHGWVLVLTAHYDEVEQHLQRAETALATHPLTDQSAAMEIVGQIAATRTLVAVHRQQPWRARQLGQEALQAVPESSRYVRATLLYALGLAEWATDNAATARANFAEAARLGSGRDQRILRFSALHNLGGLLEVQGKLQLAAQTYQQALALTSAGAAAPLPLAGWAHVGLGLLCREWHRLDEAEAHLRTAVTLSQQGGFEVIAALAWFGLALTAHSRGRLPEMEQASQAAEKIVNSWQQGAPPVHVRGYQARLAGLRHDWVTAAHHCRPLPEGERHIPSEWRETEAIMRGRLLLRENKAKEALALLNELRPVAEQAERGWHLLEILVLQALAWQQLGNLPAACETFERALTGAEVEGYVHLFSDEGAVIIPLLRKAIARGVTVAYGSKLLAVLEPPAPPLPATLPGVEPLIEPLSERELEVLRLMAAGLKNQAIAEELVVVLGTVKAHINHIYQKLAVENRVQAIQRGRELGLL